MLVLLATNTADDAIGAVCCFSGETRVLMADGTTKPISEVEVGDEVLAYDPETGGARVFFRTTSDGGVEILATADKANESRVISLLQKIYG